MIATKTYRKLQIKLSVVLKGISCFHFAGIGCIHVGTDSVVDRKMVCVGRKACRIA